MYPGDGSFRQPGARPQFQNSPRYSQQSPSNRGNMRSPQSQPYFTSPHNPGYASPYYRTPNNSSPQFQNSPRYPQQSQSNRGNMRSPQSQPYFTPPHNPGYASPYYRTPNNSSPYTSTPNHMHRQAPRSCDNSPRFWQRGPHRHSPRFSPHTRFQSPRSDCNPGGSDDIQQYYHPDMLKDPWANLKPVPVSTPNS